MELEQNLKTSLLLEFYGELLTNKQRETLKLFLDDNLSLSEIALMYKTTRQAICDLVRRTEKILNNYEEKLQLLNNYQVIRSKIEQGLSLLQKVDNKDVDQAKEIFQSILEVL